MRLTDALTGYQLDKRTAHSARTVRDDELGYNRLVDFLVADRTIESVSSDDIRRVLAAMREGHQLATKTVINLWIAHSLLWTWAEKELKIPHALRGSVTRQFRAEQIHAQARRTVRHNQFLLTPQFG